MNITKKDQERAIYEKAGERIAKIRRMRGLSRQKLADMVGVSVKFIYEIERGKKGFSAANLLFLSNALEVSVSYILTGN